MVTGATCAPQPTSSPVTTTTNSRRAPIMTMCLNPRNHRVKTEPQNNTGIAEGAIRHAPNSLNAMSVLTPRSVAADEDVVLVSEVSRRGRDDRAGADYNLAPGAQGGPDVGLADKLDRRGGRGR